MRQARKIGYFKLANQETNLIAKKSVKSPIIGTELFCGRKITIN